MLTQAVLEPGKIDVIGGKEILDGIDTIYTEKIPLDSIEQSGEMTVPLVLNPASLKVAPGFTNKVKVTYEVKERSG
jgi:YbbR domain-containing protein